MYSDFRSINFVLERLRYVSVLLLYLQLVALRLTRILSTNIYAKSDF